MILLGLFAGIIQLLQKIRKPVLKRLMIVLLAAVYIFAAAVITDLVLVWVYSPEFVTERDGKKYVVGESSFLKTSLSYYDYKNALVSGNVLRICEVYEMGGYRDGCYPLRVSYYDENGRPITEDNAHQN